MTSSSLEANPRFQKLGFFLWCDCIGVPLIRDLLSTVVKALVLLLAVIVVTLFHGDFALGEWLALIIVVGCFGLICFKWHHKRWQNFTLPSGTMVLGWRGGEPQLVDNDAEIRAGALHGAHHLLLVRQQVSFPTPFTLRVGEVSVQRRAVFSVKGMMASDVTAWLTVPVADVAAELQLVVNRLLAIPPGLTVDEGDEDRVSELSRAIEAEYSRLGSQMLPGVKVRLLPVQPREPSAAVFAGCP